MIGPRLRGSLLASTDDMPTSQFGGWLRHAREARGLTVEAIASLTKIPARHVEALERGDTLPLPAFYQRAEVRAVARAVGVDEQLAVERLEAELPARRGAASRARARARARVAPEPRSIRLDHVLAIVGTGVLVAAFTGWGPFDRSAASRDTVELPEPAPVAIPQAAAAPAPERGPESSAQVTPWRRPPRPWLRPQRPRSRRQLCWPQRPRHRQSNRTRHPDGARWCARHRERHRLGRVADHHPESRARRAAHPRDHGRLRRHRALGRDRRRPPAGRATSTWIPQ